MTGLDQRISSPACWPCWSHWKECHPRLPPDQTFLHQPHKGPTHARRQPGALLPGTRPGPEKPPLPASGHLTTSGPLCGCMPETLAALICFHTTQTEPSAQGDQGLPCPEKRHAWLQRGRPPRGPDDSCLLLPASSLVLRLALQINISPYQGSYPAELTQEARVVSPRERLELARLGHMPTPEVISAASSRQTPG